MVGLRESKDSMGVQSNWLSLEVLIICWGWREVWEDIRVRL